MLYPIREFEKLHDEMNRLFRGIDSASRGQGREVVDETCTCTLNVDIVENGDEVRLIAEVPGVKPEDVKVRVEDDVLTVAGEKKFAKNEGKDTWLRVERYYGKFSRSFTLPPYVDAGRIAAEYRDGILTLHLPKKPETQPRQIEVKVG
jgi:HSP20 family protein